MDEIAFPIGTPVVVFGRFVGVVTSISSGNPEIALIEFGTGEAVWVLVGHLRHADFKDAGPAGPPTDPSAHSFEPISGQPRAHLPVKTEGE